MKEIIIIILLVLIVLYFINRASKPKKSKNSDYSSGFYSNPYSSSKDKTDNSSEFKGNTDNSKD